jgi:hypothetical protein
MVADILSLNWCLPPFYYLKLNLSKKPVRTTLLPQLLA